MRDHIIEVATTLFVERGYAGVAMREISEACGLTKAALYYHFTSKAQLLYAVVTSYLDVNAGVVEETLAEGGSSVEVLRRLVHRLFQVPGRLRAILRLALHDIDSLDQRDRERFLADYSQRFTQPLERIFAAGVASGEFRAVDPEILVWFVLGFAYPYFGLPGSMEAETDPATVDELLDLFIDGLRTRP